MKNILLATAAAAALLFAPVMASAQYAPAQPTAPITTPVAPQSTTSDNAAMAQPSTTHTAPAAPTTVNGQSSVTTMPATTAQSSTYGAQTAQSQSYNSATAPAQTAQAPSAQPRVAAQSNAPSSTSSYQTAAAPTSTGVRGQLISDTKALELAQEAGMQAVPMSAGAVCQPRSLDLAGGATHDNRNQLEFAVDRASVCELQEIALPARGASSFRQALVRQGVDANKIIEGQSGSTEARMTFAGVATSGGQYAALYNPVRTAANTQSYAPTQSPSASDASPSYAPAAPSTTAPSASPSTAQTAPAPDHSAMDHDMSQPSETAPAEPTL